MLAGMRKTPAYRILIWAALIGCLAVLWQLSLRVLNRPDWIMKQDFTNMWSAGRLNLSGENPYDPARLFAVKSELSGLDWEQQIVSLLYTPPWSLPLAMAFAALPYSTSRVAWLLLNIFLLLASALWLWRIYRGPANRRWIPLVLAVLFAPAYFVLIFGQVTIIVLFGLVGFIDQVEMRRNDWLAGLFAALMSIKPQLFYLFWIALLLWVIRTRRWKVLAGCGLAILAAAAIGSAFNPHLIADYLYTLANYSPSGWITPTLGSYLRLLFGWERFWLQFIAPLIGLAWFLWYWLRHQRTWLWSRETPLLVFVSILTTFYAWTYDQALLLAALIPAAAGLARLEGSRTSLVLGVALLLVGAVYFVLRRYFNDEWFAWFAPVLLLWYGLAVRQSQPAMQIQPGEPA